jgi:hypothetical protein
MGFHRDWVQSMRAYRPSIERLKTSVNVPIASYEQARLAALSFPVKEVAKPPSDLIADRAATFRVRKLKKWLSIVASRSLSNLIQ